VTLKAFAGRSELSIEVADVFGRGGDDIGRRWPAGERAHGDEQQSR
jgi:hypothetical protein